METSEILQLVGACLTAVGAILAAAKTRMLRRFTKARAVSPQTAISIGEVNPLMRWFLHRFEGSQVLLRAESGQIYLDEQAYVAYRRKRRIMAISIVLSLLVLIAVIYLLKG